MRFMELSGGYVLLTAPSDAYPKGYYVDVVANVSTWLGIVVATDAAQRSQSFEYPIVGRGPSGTIVLERVPLTLNTTTRGLVAGGRLTTSRDPDLQFFVQVLGGAAHLSAHADINNQSTALRRDVYDISRWRATVQAGGGANIAINPRIAARIGIDYRRLERVPMSFAQEGNRGHGPDQLMFTLGAAWMLWN